MFYVLQPSWNSNLKLEEPMTPHVRKFIPDEEIMIFERIRNAVAVMPDIEFGNDEENQPIVLSCHMLARAVGAVFSLQYIDGYFYPRHDHSWLITPRRNIIDVYPVATLGGPTMIDGNNGIMARQLYYPGGTQGISRGRFERPSFKVAVLKICGVLRSTGDVT